jgi:hypothetical protein
MAWPADFSSSQAFVRGGDYVLWKRSRLDQPIVAAGAFG